MNTQINLGIVKGWLLSQQDVPAVVMTALEALISSSGAARGDAVEKTMAHRLDDLIAPFISPPPAPKIFKDEAITESPSRESSPEENEHPAGEPSSPGRKITATERQEIIRLYDQGIKPREIIQRLNLPLTFRARIYTMITHHKQNPGQTVAPGRRVNKTNYNPHPSNTPEFEARITEYKDDQGRTIKKCPTAYARGAYPQKSVGCKG